MKASNWDTLSAWFNAWLAADAVERDTLRAQLALEQPDLLARLTSWPRLGAISPDSSKRPR